MALLHVSDWNMRDKYYNVPKDILIALRNKAINEDHKDVWQWFIAQVEYDERSAGKPVKCLYTVVVDEMNEEFFLDFMDMKLSASEWDEELLNEAK